MRKALFLLAPAAILLARPAGACPELGSSPSAADAVATIANMYLHQATGFCIAAIANGEIARDCEGDAGNGSRPQRTTLFEIGSLTKGMTGTLLALRIAQGSIALSDSIGPKIGFKSLDPSITIYDLAHHLSGLPRNPQRIKGGVSSESEFYQGVYDCFNDSSCFDPNVTYSNYGFDVLGDILADENPWVTSWASANKIELMTPLGMTNTLTYEQFHQNLTLTNYFDWHAATGHDINGAATLPADPATWSAAAGALYSSLDEMLIWLQYNQGSLSSSLNALLPTIRTGLGWNVSAPVCTSLGSYFSKPGSTPGFNSYIGYDQVGGRGVVVLVNDVPKTDPQLSVTMGMALMHQLP